MIHLSPLPDGTTLFVPFSFGHGQLELTGRGTSIVTDDLNTILRDDLEYAVATVAPCRPSRRSQSVRFLHVRVVFPVPNEV